MEVLLHFGVRATSSVNPVSFQVPSFRTKSFLPLYERPWLAQCSTCDSLSHKQAHTPTWPGALLSRHHSHNKCNTSSASAASWYSEHRKYPMSFIHLAASFMLSVDQRCLCRKSAYCYIGATANRSVWNHFKITSVLYTRQKWLLLESVKVIFILRTTFFKVSLIKTKENSI